MTREQLVQRLCRAAEKEGKAFEVMRDKGKRSHYRVTHGDKKTTIHDKLNPNRIGRMPKQLGIDPAAF